MKVKITHDEGNACVEIINPVDGACVKSADIPSGSEVTITVGPAHEAEDFDFGEGVIETPKAEEQAQEEEQESDPGGTGEPGSMAAGSEPDPA